jgi:hypothetical protein
MSATGHHIGSHAPARRGGGNLLVLVAALVLGVTLGAVADRIISDRTASSSALEPAVVLPATGWQTNGAALHESASRAMNAVLASQARAAAAEWATSGADVREHVNRAMNGVLARKARAEWATAGAELRERINRAMNAR